MGSDKMMNTENRERVLSSNNSEFKTLAEGPIGNAFHPPGQEWYESRQANQISATRTMSPIGLDSKSKHESGSTSTKHPIGHLRDINDV